MNSGPHRPHFLEELLLTLEGPKDMWPILIQCKQVGKAQEIVSFLSLEKNLKYEVLKYSILCELVPKGHRQRFRNHKIYWSSIFVWTKRGSLKSSFVIFISLCLACPHIVLSPVLDHILV